MSNYTTEEVETILNRVCSDVICILDPDRYKINPELHLHNTEFDHETQEIILQGEGEERRFGVESIESIVKNEQTADGLGLQ